VKLRNLVLLVFMLVFIALPTQSGWASETPNVGGRGTDPNSGNFNITVYKDPACKCCDKWIQHLEKHGFQVNAIATSDMDRVKQDLGLPQNLASCHTGVINQRLIEGHVPADDIQRLFQQKQAIAGLAVPQMPVGTPGMEMPDGQKDPFTVFSYDQQGQILAFNHYE
jgi:hypothetical protein